MFAWSCSVLIIITNSQLALHPCVFVNNLLWVSLSFCFVFRLWFCLIVLWFHSFNYSHFKIRNLKIEKFALLMEIHFLSSAMSAASQPLQQLPARKPNTSRSSTLFWLTPQTSKLSHPHHSSTFERPSDAWPTNERLTWCFPEHTSSPDESSTIFLWKDFLVTTCEIVSRTI